MRTSGSYGLHTWSPVPERRRSGGLAEAVHSCWLHIRNSYIRRLNKSIPARLISIIKKEGGSIDS